jgi:hypothetical protein
MPFNTCMQRAPAALGELGFSVGPSKPGSVDGT